MATVMVLEGLGCTTLEAADAEEALFKLKGDPLVIVLFTDINMAGPMDGLGLAHEVRRQRPDVVIVISSGRPLPDHPALPEGATFIQKPYNAEDLERIAKRAGCAFASPSQP
jgi:CheY-like chemotaxis protein